MTETRYSTLAMQHNRLILQREECHEWLINHPHDHNNALLVRDRLRRINDELHNIYEENIEVCKALCSR